MLLVLNNFMQRRSTTKSSDLRSTFLRGGGMFRDRTMKSANIFIQRIGKHFSEATLPILPIMELALGCPMEGTFGVINGAFEHCQFLTSDTMQRMCCMCYGSVSVRPSVRHTPVLSGPWRLGPRSIDSCGTWSTACDDSQAIFNDKLAL